MACALIDLLKIAYPRAYGAKWKEHYTVWYEISGEDYFEIKDRRPQIIQPNGEGVAAFSNQREERIVVVDFEQYVNQYTNALRAGSGQKCDFILCSEEWFSVFVLNELTETKERYLEAFVQPQEGERRTGKREKALRQLEASIEKLYAVPELEEYINRFERKVALFSYRIPEGDKGEVGMSMAAFARPMSIVSSIQSSDTLGHGFSFQQRLYPQPMDM